jgi:predicted anti-sigma-YlaC factor YlaD
MDCDTAREAISARIDDEDSGVPDAALEAHLSGCAACRAWEQRAHVVTRRARLGGAFLDHDLTARVRAAAPPPPARRLRGLTQRGALVIIAVAQLAITVPLLVLGHDHGAGTHAAHELGSFDLALAIAFCVGAIRPALSAGLAWPCCIAAGGLVGTAVLDLIDGQTFGADEAQHLIALAGAFLLLWQARTASTGTAGPGLGAIPRQAGDQSVTLSPAGSPGREAPERPFSGGTDAARADGPAVAARSGDAAAPADSRASQQAGEAGAGQDGQRYRSDPQEAVA